MTSRRIGLAGRGAKQLARVRMTRYLPESVAGVAPPLKTPVPTRDPASMSEEELVRLLADMVYEMLRQEALLQTERRGISRIGR